MSNENEKPDGWVCVLTALNKNLILAISDSVPDFAWVVAEMLSGIKQQHLEQIGYEVRPVKITFLDDEEEWGR